MILESKIAPTTAYQKQQETLICWSENDQELALSFQLIDSCSEIWEKICDVSKSLREADFPVMIPYNQDNVNEGLLFWFDRDSMLPIVVDRTHKDDRPAIT